MHRSVCHQSRLNILLFHASATFRLNRKPRTSQGKYNSNPLATRLIQLKGFNKDAWKAKPFKSLSENWEGCCGEGFWSGRRRSGTSIPTAGCKACDNEVRLQKSRRPKGFRGQAPLAALLLSQISIKDILPRRALP